ncbi:hypothetical protein CYLTODRAFT_488161 [Cylindrobasidium torrendii FP15055 ss-10]|uniref:RING-type E3 ubiquitin transferase n=1 Tax=Cylindrobasidium torrendii FP15055 ss-10 TaxID=1314674 RepID=A0A0D7BL78_9AGAR|nr:hypothetical protein CYLTODRAFT_488161 [Cylindrobasidium torrendii FP15055 ss-10]
MATAVATETAVKQGKKQRNYKRENGKGKGPAAPESVGESSVTSTGAPAPTEELEDAVCWICAEPVKYYALSQCNHRTCHVCALRLRALYKKTECTFCKEPQTMVVFTTSDIADYATYTAEITPFKDDKLAIRFETKEMMEDTLLLLRFNCPDTDCDFIAKGWSDLKLHVRAVHNKLMCEVCIRSKKVFAHEHALYLYPQLVKHMPSMNHRLKSLPDQVEGGVHPLCEFCRECFFSEDELFSHMRERHEECFICKRNGVRDQYFQNYERLEIHFNNSHHPCMHANCQAQKFVVFNTALDLQGHMMDEHGTTMSTRDKKDARRVDVDFEQAPRRGGRRDREQEHDPPPRQQAPAGPGPGTANSRRREAFNARLTGGNTTSAPSTPRAASPLRESADPATLSKHNAFLERLQSYATNPSNAVPAVKAAIRGYRASESSARDVISTIFNVLDRHLEHTASIINSFVDLLEEEEKKADLLTSWKGFEVEQRQQFPDLVPTTTGQQYAGITSGRVLNAKHGTGSRAASGKVQDRVARAASSSQPYVPGAGPPPAAASSSKFPALSSTAKAPAPRQAQYRTPWTATASRPAAAAPAPIVPRSVPGSLASSSVKRAPPPKLDHSAFPGLPTATNQRAKVPMSGNTSLKNIVGGGPPPPVRWGASGEEEVDNVVEAEPQQVAPGKGKKGKGKQKQTLFTLGTFPS